jgi:ArsR family transcriptional regulator, arsenate/arsenite/antimonite-responsive transcriptional repressor
MPRAGKSAALSARDLHRISRAVADPRRFQILQHIAAGECAACSELRSEFPVTAATLSHHLKELEAAGLIEIARRGKFIDARFCREKWQAYVNTLAAM